MSKVAGLLAIALMSASAPAPAAGIDPATSHIRFTFKQMNVPVEGSFQRFHADIQFNPAQPERASASIEVDLGSIDTGSRDGDVEAKRRPWFDVGAFPTAKFVSSAVRRTGEDRYEVTGRMTIKGRGQELTVPLTVNRATNSTSFEGEFPLHRLAFAIGEGPWADTDTVADIVQVRFRLVQRNQ